MEDQYFYPLTPLQRGYLKAVFKQRSLKWLRAFILINATPFCFSFLGNLDMFSTAGFQEACRSILRNGMYIAIAFFPILIILWGYLLYLLFTKIIPLLRDIRKGNKQVKTISVEKYSMYEFSQFFIRTTVKEYPFFKVNPWIFEQIPDGIPLLLETAPRSVIYLGLRIPGSGEVILTEQPESIY